MIDLIQQHRGDLKSLCRRYHFTTQMVFGSAGDGIWDPQRNE